MSNQKYIETLCSNIHILRERSGLSTEEMAARLRIPAEAVTRLEGGNLPEDLTLEALVRIGNEFGISLKDIFLPL